MFYDLGPGIFLPETDPRFYAIPRDDAAVLRSDPNRSDSIVRLSHSLERRSLSSLLSPSLFSYYFFNKLRCLVRALCIGAHVLQTKTTNVVLGTIL